MVEPQVSTDSNSNRNKLVSENVPLVRYVVERMAIGCPPHLDRSDLVSYGIIGLIQAADSYCPKKGVKFSTYAIPRIRGAIIDELRRQDWMPRSLRDKYHSYQQRVGELEQNLGRRATDEELMDAFDMEEDQFRDFLDEISPYSLVSFEEVCNMLSSGGRDQDPLSAVEYQEVVNILTDAIDRLSEKENMVITLYYYEGLTQKEISSIMDLSPARISQLHSKAILRLRGYLSRRKNI